MSLKSVFLMTHVMQVNDDLTGLKFTCTPVSCNGSEAIIVCRKTKLYLYVVHIHFTYAYYTPELSPCIQYAQSNHK